MHVAAGFAVVALIYPLIVLMERGTPAACVGFCLVCVTCVLAHVWRKYDS